MHTDMMLTVVVINDWNVTLFQWILGLVIIGVFGLMFGAALGTPRALRGFLWIIITALASTALVLLAKNGTPLGDHWRDVLRLFGYCFGAAFVGWIVGMLASDQ